MWPVASPLVLAFVAINSIATVDRMTPVVRIDAHAIGLGPQLVGH